MNVERPIVDYANPRSIDKPPRLPPHLRMLLLMIFVLTPVTLTVGLLAFVYYVVLPGQ